MKGGGHRETWTPTMIARLHELHAEELFELQDGDCRWPVHGEKMGMLYCGRPKVRGSYCFKHARLSSGGKGQ
jgi:hypothetical protein